MIAPDLTPILLPLIVGLSLLLVLLRPRSIPEVYWVSAAGVLLAVRRLIPLTLFDR